MAGVNKNIVILISGSGSNMAAIVETSLTQRWQDRFGARVVAVISNKAGAQGLAWAARACAHRAGAAHRLRDAGVSPAQAR